MVYKQSILVKNSSGNEFSARYLNTLNLGWSVVCPRPVERRSDGRKIWVDPIVASIEKLPRFAQWRFQNWNEQYPLVSFQGCEIAGILLLIPWTVKTWALFPHWLYCAKNYFLKWSVPQTLGQFASFCCLRVSKHRILVWWSFLKELLTNSEPFKGRPSIWHNCADFTAKTLPI